MKREWWKKGKTTFTGIDEHKDLSGRDLLGFLFEPPLSLARGFLNGTTVDDCAFIAVDLSHCEFAEAHFSKTFMKSVDLNGSDLVGARFEDMTFEDCDFTSGEWRDTQFVRVTFTRCSFEYTTINLCTFVSCTFCNESTEWLDHNAVNYNVFSDSHFNSSVRNPTVLSRNFGLPGKASLSAMIPLNVGPSLEEVCLASSCGVISIPAFVNAIDNEFLTSSGTRLKKLRLEFISNIIASLAREGAISASSMIYAEKIFQNLAQTITNESDFRTAMSAIINIRNALFQSGIEASDTWHEYELFYCSHILIHYEREFSRADAEELAEDLAYVAIQDSTAIHVTNIRPGSTIIDLAVSSVVTASSVLMATNFLLRQATITIKRAYELKKCISDLSKVTSVQPRSPKTNRSDKIPAIMKSGAVLSEYQPLREVVEKNGKRVVRFDEKADVVIHIQAEPGGKKRGRANLGANSRDSAAGRNTHPSSSGALWAWIH